MCNVLYTQVIGKWNERLLLNVSDVVWAQVLVGIWTEQRLLTVVPGSTARQARARDTEERGHN